MTMSPKWETPDLRSESEADSHDQEVWGAPAEIPVSPPTIPSIRHHCLR